MPERKRTAAASRAAGQDADRLAKQARRRRDATMIARLEAELAAQAALLRSQAEALAHSRKIFDRASQAARIGVWECSLPDEKLTWTDVVYDLFDLPRGTQVDRAQALKCYSAESAKDLHRLRSRAIEERGGFSLDAEIVTALGRRRWIRITASVECEEGVPVRIFGMKQDITEEKILADRMRQLAEFDVLTGLANRGQFQSRLADCAGDAGHGALGALLLVDLDAFKAINDSFGHVVGDHCLKEAALRLKLVCRDADLVARVGGDEFAVLASGRFGPAAARELARRIVRAMARPIELNGEPFKLGASVGIALATDCAPADLFQRADTALYAAKAAGRGTFRMFRADDRRAGGPRVAA